MKQILALVGAAALSIACESKSDPAATPGTEPATPTAAAPAAAPARPALLLTQAQFKWETNAEGKRIPKPGPAKLVRLAPSGSTWQAEILEDADSRVFHKAVCHADQMLTIAGTDAHLKTWSFTGGAWKGQSHWKPSFGGKWDRLRDFEIGDVDGDGTDDLVLGTHDQGVVAVATMDGEGLTPTEIFRKADTFIHEIEIGDVDGDGKLEFYATPSEPNKADKSQGGGVMVFKPRDGKLTGSMIVEFPKRHAKEILVTDLDGDGKDELYVSLEAESKKVGGQTQILKPLEIQRYTLVGKKWKGHAVAVLDKGVQARVLLAGDVTGTGKRDLIVTTWKDGVWRLVGDKKPGIWKSQQIDADSSGFEHAAGLADMDGDGKLELYVAADDQDEVRQYVYNGNGFDRKGIYGLAKSDLTWSIEACM